MQVFVTDIIIFANKTAKMDKVSVMGIFGSFFTAPPAGIVVEKSENQMSSNAKCHEM